MARCGKDENNKNSAGRGSKIRGAQGAWTDALSVLDGGAIRLARGRYPFKTGALSVLYEDARKAHEMKWRNEKVL